MNRRRHAELERAIRKFCRVYSAAAEKLVDDLESIREREQEAYDNLPDSLTSTERADEMLENVNALEDALFALDDDPDFIQDLAEHFELEIC